MYMYVLVMIQYKKNKGANMALASTTAAYTLIGLASKFQEFFYSDAADVTFEYMNEDGEKLSTSVPNVAKIEDNLIKNGGISKRILVTEDVTLDDYAYYSVDTTDARTLTLPAEPVDGDFKIILDYAKNAQNNPVTVEGNGIKIEDEDDDLTLDVNGFFVLVVYNESAGSWYVANASSSK